jgi:phosphoglycerate dehydrogenase-like enzyme
MKKIKILLTRELSPVEIDYINKNLDENYILILPEKYTEEELLKNVEDADILLGDTITKSILDKGTKVKLIQVPWAGVERLDFDVLSDYNIPVCNSHSNALCVAEYGVGLLLSIAKKIPYHDKLLREGNWNRNYNKENDGRLSPYSSYITNKTVGFIGYGNIAKNMAKLMRGFNCKYMAIVSNRERQYEELDFVGDVEDLDYVLSNSDYVVVAAALTKETRGMLNINNLTKMKKTGYIINISRGKIIDEESLYYVLENKLIAGAAIDTWYNYPMNSKEVTYPSKKFDFHKLDNIIISPHRAAQIIGEVPYLDDAIYNINEFSKNRNYINKLNLDKGY